MRAEEVRYTEEDAEAVALIGLETEEPLTLVFDSPIIHIHHLFGFQKYLGDLQGYK